MDRLIEKENREFLRAGTIAAAIYNVNRDPKRHPQPLSAADIFSLPRPAALPPSREEILRNAEKFFTLYNKRNARLEGRRRGTA